MSFNFWGSRLFWYFRWAGSSTKIQQQHFYMGVSKNRGTPKWMVYNGKLYKNGWFGGYHYLRKHPYAPDWFHSWLLATKQHQSVSGKNAFSKTEHVKKPLPFQKVLLPKKLPPFESPMNTRFRLKQAKLVAAKFGPNSQSFSQTAISSSNSCGRPKGSLQQTSFSCWGMLKSRQITLPGPKSLKIKDVLQKLHLCSCQLNLEGTSKVQRERKSHFQNSKTDKAWRGCLRMAVSTDSFDCRVLGEAPNHGTNLIIFMAKPEAMNQKIIILKSSIPQTTPIK